MALAPAHWVLGLAVLAACAAILARWHLGTTGAAAAGRRASSRESPTLRSSSWSRTTSHDLSRNPVHPFPRTGLTIRPGVRQSIVWTRPTRG